MRILHVIHSLSGGGAERQICEMLKHSKDTNMDMAVFCVNACGKERELAKNNLFVFSDSSKYPWGLIGEVDVVIKKFNPDLVHCWLPVPVILPAMIAAKKNNIPVVASYRNKKSFNGVYDIIEYLAIKFMASAIASNNPPSQSIKAFQKLFHQKVSAYIPNSISIDSSLFKKADSYKSGETFTILFVGRIFDAQKNWRSLLQGLKKVGGRHDWKLLICGDGKERDELIDAMNVMDLSSQVELLGYRDDVYDIMQSADVLVLPSWYEGMPNVVVEAMALSLPCIVSEITAHKELFGDEAGICYMDPAEPTTLTSIINDMISSKINLDDMALQGKIFSSKFTPEKLMQSYEKLYSQTLGLNSDSVIEK